MKIFLKRFLLTALVCTVLLTCAYAADFTHCADAMKDMGLFRGTQNGYELDRAPTRAEAAVMLVRLLGAEEEASSLAYSAPYTDVADWAKPYVQYLHDKKLTKGTGTTTFGYSEKCTAGQYATFLLRALGYSDSDGGDFTYSEALEFAREKGVVDELNCNETEFLRDHVAAMSYTALATTVKSGGADLLTTLVKSGAVADAKGLDEHFSAYRDMAKNMSKLAKAEKLSMNTEMTSEFTISGEKYMTSVQNFEYAAERNTENPDMSKASYVGEITSSEAPDMSKTVAVKYYYSDGCIYSDVNGEKSKNEAPFADALKACGVVSFAEKLDPICAFSSIEKKASTGGTATYTAEYAEFMFKKTSADSKILDMKMTLLERASNPAQITLDTKLSITADGKEYGASVVYKNTSIDISGKAKVYLPSDLGNYL